jgi:hypothetical protein
MSKRSRVWSDEEEAYLLNYLDYCLKHQLRYQDEITAAMSRFAGRSITINSAMSKLAQVSLRNGGERSTKALVTNGTNELALQRVPGRVLRAMQAQRADLELEDLATESDTTNDETPDEHMVSHMTTCTPEAILTFDRPIIMRLVNQAATLATRFAAMHVEHQPQDQRQQAQQDMEVSYNNLA